MLKSIRRVDCLVWFVRLLGDNCRGVKTVTQSFSVEEELRAIARYGSTVSLNKVTDDGQGTTVDDRRLDGLGILDFWGIVGGRGTECSTCEKELRAIARYGSTVSISEVTDDGQGTTVNDRRLEGLGILDFWGIVG